MVVLSSQIINWEQGPHPLHYFVLCLKVGLCLWNWCLDITNTALSSGPPHTATTTHLCKLLLIEWWMEPLLKRKLKSGINECNVGTVIHSFTHSLTHAFIHWTLIATYDLLSSRIDCWFIGELDAVPDFKNFIGDWGTQTIKQTALLPSGKCQDAISERHFTFYSAFWKR